MRSEGGEGTPMGNRKGDDATKTLTMVLRSYSGNVDRLVRVALTEEQIYSFVSRH